MDLLKNKALIIVLAVVILVCIGFFVFKPTVSIQISENSEKQGSNLSVPEIYSDKILITDSENHRLITVTLDSEKKIDWQYGCSKVNNLGRCSTESLYHPSAATESVNSIIVADRENHRVLELSKTGEIKSIITSADGRNLWYPNYAAKLSNNHILVCDGFNNRILELDENSNLIWKYGCSRINSAGKCAYGTGDNEIRNPHMAERMPDGNTLITDSENNRIIIVNSTQNIVWEFKSGISNPYAAHSLKNGNTLIANSKANSVIEIDKNKEIVWEMKTGLSFPTDAFRLDNGNTIIIDSHNNRVIEVEEDGSIVWQYGSGTFGAGANELANPTFAVII